MKNKIYFTLIATLGLALSGCKTHEGAYAPVNTDVNNLENSCPVVLMDKSVQNSVTTAGIQQGVLSDGRLKVVANIRNRETRRIQVQVSCVFKDEQGFSTGDETPWQNLILTENSQEAVRFVSANNKAKKFTIRIRQAH